MRTACHKSQSPQSHLDSANCSLLPSHLPHWAIRLPKPSGRRSLRRWRANCAAVRWAAWLLAFFNYWELGCPKAPAEYRELGRAYGVTRAQDDAFRHLVESCRQLCRTPPTLPGLGRGQRKLVEVLNSLQSAFAVPGANSQTQEIAVAETVDVDRVNLPSQAYVAKCDPADWVEPWLKQYVNDPCCLQLPRSQWPGLMPLPNVCHMISKHDELTLARRLIAAGAAVLVPADIVPNGPDQKPMSSGWFGVYHSSTKQRLINDRRRPNHVELRLHSCRWPMGAQLCVLVLEPWESIRGSGKDLRSYYNQLLHRDPTRNVVGRVMLGKEFPDVPCDPQGRYMLGLCVWSMGNQNACEVAHQTHAGVLRAVGGLAPHRLLEWGRPVPDSSLLEGLIIDDYIVIQICPTSQLHSPIGLDRQLMSSASAAYRDAHLEEAVEKDVDAQPVFTAWGTTVDSNTGEVSAPLGRRSALAWFDVFCASLPAISPGLLRRLLGLHVHHFSHNKLLMSVFHRAYRWMTGLHEHRMASIPMDIRMELMAAALLLPLARTNIRTPVSDVLSCTDATPISAGGVQASVTPALARQFYFAAVHKGAHVQLGGTLTHRRMDDTPFQPKVHTDLETVLAHIPWQCTRSFQFSQTSHVNLQELRACKAELVSRAQGRQGPCRAVNGVDSTVVAGAWAHGRSSSVHVNGLLRSRMAWQEFSQVRSSLFWMRSEANPSDAPSRFRPVVPPLIPTPGSSLAAALTPAQKFVPTRTRGRDRTLFRQLMRSGTCQEFYAGGASLSKALRACATLHVDVPFEAFPKKGCYRPEFDLSLDVVRHNLRMHVSNGHLLYAHFGVPCKDWAALSRLNGGTRSKLDPTGSLPRELAANGHASFVAELCTTLSALGGLWTIENPTGSYLFLFPPIQALCGLPNVHDVTFDQCCFGLQPPDGPPGKFVKKQTTVRSNVPSLSSLSRKCPRDHEHVHAMGSVLHNGQWQSRAKLAGHYPPGLCKQWAACVEAQVQLLRQTDQPPSIAGSLYHAPPATEKP